MSLVYAGWKNWPWIVLLCVISIVVSIISAQVTGYGCRDTTVEFTRMESGRVHLSGPDGRDIELNVRVADEGYERAAGFQHICPEIADEVSIVFLFSSPNIPKFHMRNVYMPLDIAFFDTDRVIRSIQTMEPYVLGKRDEKLWSPGTPVVGALEVRGGLFKELGVTENDWSIHLEQ